MLQRPDRLPLEEHRRAVRDLLQGAFEGVEQVVLADGLNLRLAEELVAPMNLPVFNNSQMDGYAVASAETRTAEVFTVAAPVPAGHAAPGHQPGTAVPVMTGAMLPSGADAVVPIERAEPDRFFPEGAAASVRLPRNVPSGQFVRLEGSDIRGGEQALRQGQLLGPAQLGLAAALGVAEVRVRRRPRVLLVSTGDEVVPPGGTLSEGQIHDANTTILGACLADAGAEVLPSRVTADSPSRFIETLDGVLAASDVDLIITSGGISAGAYEVVRQALGSRGVEFVSVNMQPGGPQAIGRYSGVPFLGFPGNPVSAWVSFEVFLRPVLGAAGGAGQARQRRSAALVQALESPHGKHQFRRAVVSGSTVRAVGGPGSHLLRAMAEANALIHVPPDVVHVAAGESVDVWITGPESEGDANDRR